MGRRDPLPAKGMYEGQKIRIYDRDLTTIQILSFSKALPLQIHPDLKLAEKLHKEDPKKFGDTMHKPEIAIALSKFELFAGWKPLSDIQALLKLNCLSKFIPKSDQFNDETLRQVCKALLSAPAEEVAQTSKDIQALPESQFGAHSYIPSLLGRLAKQYGEGDNGNLVATLLMNYMTLGPGDSVFVPADSIHAYLEGDIVECMARSDNVINTGFCPAADRDSVELFGEALTFKPHSSQDALLARRKSDKGMHGKTDVYAPPISEFSVLCTTLGAGEKETHKAILGPSLMIVTKGSGRMNIPGNQAVELKEGYVFFVGQGVALDFATEKGLAVYRAYAE
jgi:mannose-6-phosphate isomerase